jgi:hypothetical protein
LAKLPIQLRIHPRTPDSDRDLYRSFWSGLWLCGVVAQTWFQRVSGFQKSSGGVRGADWRVFAQLPWFFDGYTINGAIGGFFIGWLGEHSFWRLTRVVVFVAAVSLILGTWLIELRSDDYTGMITLIAGAVGLAWPLLRRTLLL